MQEGSSRRTWASFEPDLLPSTLTVDPGRLEELSPEAIAVDLGCGLGGTVRQLVTSGVKAVIGIDINARALHRAGSSAATARATFVASDAARLPLRDESVTVVVAEALMTTLTDKGIPQECLAEAYRVLERGGRLLIADFSQSWHSEAYRERYLGAVEKGHEVGTFDVEDDETGQILYRAHHYTEREITELLREAGFAIESFVYEHAMTWRQHKVYAMRIEARRPL